MFPEVHWDNVLSRFAWKDAISSREMEDAGSGRRRPAENEAFAMAIWWDAMLTRNVEGRRS